LLLRGPDKLTVEQVIRTIEQAAPQAWAAEWDNVGLQVGDADSTVKRVLVTLDITREVLDEACEANAELIVAHHPVIFKPLTSVIAADANSTLVWHAARNGVAIFVAHTNLDVAPEIGTACALADALGLQETQVILQVGNDSAKIVVFVPDGAVEAVIDAMASAGAGRIGAYGRCAFFAPGTGTFEPGRNAHPAVGEPGRREEVREFRLEMVCPRSLVPQVISAMRAVHPYEEPAYDVYPLGQPPGRRGYGRTGKLPVATTLSAFAQGVADKLDAQVQIIGEPEAVVELASVVPGSGGAHLLEAGKSQDVVVTGEVKHDEALAARMAGINVVVAGHYATERPVVPRLAEYLRGQLGTEVEVIESSMCTAPFRRGAR